jgi:outer membrane murein-binding lipoprotein Lpp
MKWCLIIAAVIASSGMLGCESNKKSDPSLKEGAREVGHAVGSAAREVGQGAKKAGKAVGEAAKEGGRAFKDAVKGD